MSSSFMSIIIIIIAILFNIPPTECGWLYCKSQAKVCRRLRSGCSYHAVFPARMNCFVYMQEDVKTDLSSSIPDLANGSLELPSSPGSDENPAWRTVTFVHKYFYSVLTPHSQHWAQSSRSNVLVLQYTMWPAGCAWGLSECDSKKKTKRKDSI